MPPHPRGTDPGPRSRDRTAPHRPGPQVPNNLRGALVAVFNSGWKIRDSRGGFYTEGRPIVPLQNGAASLVIDTSGRVSVGLWGRDVRMGPQVEAVRQNLALVVHGGRRMDVAWAPRLLAVGALPALLEHCREREPSAGR